MPPWPLGKIIKRNAGIAGVLFITAVIFFPSLFYHFVADDYEWVTGIVACGSSHGPFSFTVPSYAGMSFRPLIWVPYLFGFSVSGLPIPPDPRWLSGDFLFSYHIFSVLIHLANVFLVYLIANFVLKSRFYAVFAAFIFALHPINSEAICWIAAFADPAYTFFTLLSIILFTKSYIFNKPVYYLGSLASFILALSSKEMALILPFLIISIIFFLRNSENIRVEGKKRLSWLAYFVILAIYMIFRSFLKSPSSVGDGVVLILDALNSIPDKIVKLAYFLRELFFPLELGPIKESLYRHSLVNFVIILFLFFTVALICWFIARTRKTPVLFYIFLWTAISLALPVFIPFWLSKRYLYFSLVSYSILISFIFSRFKKKDIGILCLSVIIIFEVSTFFMQNGFRKLSGEVVRDGLWELKLDLPSIEPGSVIYLAGLPGLVKNTYAFWAVLEDKIRFLYKDTSLEVFNLSAFSFTEKEIKEPDLVFFDDRTIVQTIGSGFESYIRLTQEAANDPAKDGQWMPGQFGRFRQKILKRDKSGRIKEVVSQLNLQGLKGRKIYILGYKNGKMGVLKSFLANED